MQPGFSEDLLSTIDQTTKHNVLFVDAIIALSNIFSNISWNQNQVIASFFFTINRVNKKHFY